MAIAGSSSSIIPLPITTGPLRVGTAALRGVTFGTSRSPCASSKVASADGGVENLLDRRQMSVASNQEKYNEYTSILGCVYPSQSTFPAPLSF